MNTTNTNLSNHLSDLITDSDGAHRLKIEKGIWTPGLKVGTNTVNFTYTAQNARYIKINKMVTVWFDIVVASKGSATGQLFIDGLPFPVVEIGSGATMGPSYLGYPNGATTIALHATGANIELWGIGNNFIANLDNTHVIAGNTLQGQLSYITN